MQIEFDPNTYLTDVLEKLKQNKQLNTFNKDLVALVVNDLFHKYFLCYETIRNVKQLKDLDLSVEKEFNTLFNIKNSYAYDIEKLFYRDFSVQLKNHLFDNLHRTRNSR